MIHAEQSENYLVQYNTPTADIDKTIKPNISGKDIFKTISSLVPETIKFILTKLRKYIFLKIQRQFSLLYDRFKLLDICCVSLVDCDWPVS